MASDDDHYVLEPEDWFCGLGVVCATVITIAGSWARTPDIAMTLTDQGLSTGGMFVALWVIGKIIRAIRG